METQDEPEVQASLLWVTGYNFNPDPRTPFGKNLGSCVAVTWKTPLLPVRAPALSHMMTSGLKDLNTPP